MPSSYRFKPQEQEVPDNVLVVMIGVKTGDYVLDSQLLLGVFQQRHESVLAAFRQLVLSDRHIEPVLPEHGFPLAAYTADSGRREGQFHRLPDVRLKRVATNGGANAGFQPKLDWVRGISYPRASALWEFPTCAGNIKPAVEAPHRGC